MLLGYVRVSTVEQNEERQIRALIEKGVEEENLYIDKQSGKNADRAKLKDFTTVIMQRQCVTLSVNYVQ